MNHKLIYVAADGNFGDATDMLLVNSDGFTDEDWQSLSDCPDRYRLEEADEIAVYRSNEPVVWAWLTKSEAEKAIGALQRAGNYLTHYNVIGLADELDEIRDLLHSRALGLEVK